MMTIFDNIAEIGVDHLGDIYIEESRATIVELVGMTIYFPSFVYEGIMGYCWQMFLSKNWKWFFVALEKKKVLVLIVGL